MMNALLSQLRTLAETSVGKQMKTPKDFSALSQRIYSRLHQHVSATTLKRLWGYQQDEGPARRTTLNIMAQFCGFANWDSFVKNSEHGDSQSAIILGRYMAVDTMEPGTLLQLTWAPNRVCNIRYTGNHNFYVVKSLNAKLQPGDTFRCDVLIEQQPLYIYNLVQDPKKPAVSYYAGRQDGIRFEVLK